MPVNDRLPDGDGLDDLETFALLPSSPSHARDTPRFEQPALRPETRPDDLPPAPELHPLHPDEHAVYGRPYHDESGVLMDAPLSWRQLGERALGGAARAVRAARPPLPGTREALAGLRERLGHGSTPTPAPAPRPPVQSGGYVRGPRPTMPVSQQASTASAEPVNMAAIVRGCQAHVIVRDQRTQPDAPRFTLAEGFNLLITPLPESLIALVNPGAAHILLNARLFSETDRRAAETAILAPSVLGGGWVERQVERSRTLRLALAACWLRWHQWPDLVAAQLDAPPGAMHNLPDIAAGTSVYALTQPYAVGWGIATSAHVRDTLWTETHPDTYTLLWKRLGQLLAPARMLAAQTRHLLGLDHETPLPPLGEHWPLVWDWGRRLGAPNRGQAEARYLRELASVNRLPLALIQSRLEGDWEVPSLEVWRGVSASLVSEASDLALWRGDLAERYGVAPEEVCLFLHEPALLLAGPHGEVLGAGTGGRYERVPERWQAPSASGVYARTRPQDARQDNRWERPAR